MTVFIAVDGRAGAGKTSIVVELARLLRRRRSVAVVHLQDMYPGWDGLAEGVERCAVNVLPPLLRGQAAQWRSWDWPLGADGEERVTEPSDIVILEGVGAGSAVLRAHCVAVVWVEAPADHRQRRAVEGKDEAYAANWDRWAAQEDAWLAVDDVPSAAAVTVTAAAGTHQGGAAELALMALEELPVLGEAIGFKPSRPAGDLVFRRLSAEPDPEGLFAGLFGDSSHAVWLDASDVGMPQARPRSRFSIMADDGGLRGRRMSHRNGLNEVVFGPGTATPVTARFTQAFFLWLASAWGRPGTGSPANNGEPRGLMCAFKLGWLGYLGYGLKRECGHNVATDTSADDAPGDAQLIFTARAVVLDHELGHVWLLAFDAQDADTWLEVAEHTVRTVLPLPHTLMPAIPAPVFKARDSPDVYRAKVQAAKAEIADGNTYEVCLTTTLEATLAATPDSPDFDPWMVYRMLRRRSPASFAAFVRFGPLTIASSSPERFLSISDAGALRAEPIKGTRRRSPGADPDEDVRVRAELAANPKDRAENLMIVDLLRNDLSHFAVPGSVSVSRLFSVETYSTVHQLVSTVDARLRAGASRAQVLASAFPPGSMTGAPKISTMDILDRLEVGPRGVYSGAIGYFSQSGAGDLSVVIRTLVIHRIDGATKLTLGVGGAIVADSTPEAEHDEIRTKAFAVLNTLGAEFPE